MKPGAGIHIKFCCLELGKEGCQFWQESETKHCLFWDENRNCRCEKAKEHALKEDGYERAHRNVPKI